MGAHVESPRSLRIWPLPLLDRLLSERLRASPPTELNRYRFMTGVSLFFAFCCLVYLLGTSSRPIRVAMCISMLGYLGTLVVLRRAHSPRGPAWLLCLVLFQALTATVFLSDSPIPSLHAAHMLLPALAVYLLGVRESFLLTALLMIVLGLVYPRHYTATGTGPFFLSEAEFWPLHTLAVLSFLGAWGLGALHSTVGIAAKQRLEQTLEDLSQSENKLLSLIESTDDLICSLDLEGRLIIANSAQKRLFFRRLGKEPRVGEYFFAHSTPERQLLWKRRFAQTASGQPLRFEEEYLLHGERITLDICITPILDKERRITGMTLFSRDISARKEAEARMGEMHRTLVDASRQAGMAEIATGVLHNVGNTLNSVNVSTTLLSDLLKRSRVTGLVKATQLLREHASDLSTFFSSDPQGRKLPEYLVALSESLVQEREAMSQEIVSLTESVDHIKSVVSMQQKHARTAGAVEELQVPQLIDEALRLHALSFERMGILVERDYGNVPPVLIDRHKLLQILINLLNNARHALVESQREEKRLTIRVRSTPESQRLFIEVADNGTGIAPEHMARMFTQGFTTKKTGHGFGLHISALAATEMRGRLTCSSDGAGQGATFILELPLAVEEVRS